MVKNIKLKRKAKRLKLMRISWYQHLTSNIMLLKQQCISMKYQVCYPGSVRERLLSQHRTYIENLIVYRNKLKKQIIKCKTK